MKKTRIILFLLAFFSVSFSYAQWPHSYQAGSIMQGNSLLEFYDKGYLISASTIQYSTNEKYGIVLKTDINGNEIWRKYFTDKFRATYFQRMIQTVDGGIVIEGYVSHFNTYGFVLKLDPCGEIDWSYNLMLGAGQISSGLVELADHSLLAMFANHDWVHETAYSRFIHFDESGNLISLDSLPENGNCGQHILGQDLLITTDSNFLMPGNSSNWAEVDKQLNKKWELCGTNRIGQTILSGSGNSISVTDNSQTSNSFFILEISDNGTYISEREIQTATLNIFPNTQAICQYNDSVMAVLFFAGNSFYYINDVLQVVDTSGNTLSEILLGNFMGPVCLLKTADDKLLALENTGKLKLFKFQPTEPYEPGHYFSTSPIISLTFTYDSLCGHQIVTDTSLIQIDYALGFDEDQTEKEPAGYIKIWPNPGSGVVNLSFDKQVLNGDILQIVGIDGKVIKEIRLQPGLIRTELNTSGVRDGIYAILHLREGRMLETGKLIIHQ